MNAKSRAIGDDTDMQHKAFWTTGKWFTLLMILLALWTGLYLTAHSRYGMPGYEYTTFTSVQVRQINRILTTDNIAINITPAHNNNAATLIDSSTTMRPVNELNTYNTTIGCDIPCRTEKVLVYINSEYDNKITPDQLEAIRQYISTFGPQEVGVFLADYKLKIRSYFWLSGAMIYAELVMWVVIGVLCSLLFAAGNVLRRANKRVFDNRDVLYQIAKVFYAPFIAIIILLTYNYFKHNTSLNANLGQGIIIFAFIAGFYSGRLMSFLDRLKQLVLPDNDDNNTIAYAMAPAYVTAAPIQPIAPIQPVPEKINEKPLTVNEAYAETITTDKNGSAHTPVAAKKENSDLIDAQIEVKLDAAGLFEDEKAKLTKQGFTKAIVTLHNVNGKDIIPAKKANDSSTLFIATGVKPGIYIARATLSQKSADDQRIINLFGERTSYITIDKPGLELYIRKYELVD